MESVQQGLAVIVVLALLGGTLWVLRRRGMAVFTARAGSGSGRKMQLIERLPLTPQHSLMLVQVGGRTLLVGVSPSGCTLLDSGSTTPSGDRDGVR
jgi:flagellar biosynthetic protein FliO